MQTHLRYIVIAMALMWGGTLHGQQGRADLPAATSVRGELPSGFVSHRAERKQAAWERARQEGWAPQVFRNGVAYHLIGIDDDRVFMYKTFNAQAAITIAVDAIRETTPYDLSGANCRTALWDGNIVMADHQELIDRVEVIDDGEIGDHATHVAGTIMAQGVKTSAQGMAPAATILSYNFENDINEMAGIARSGPDEEETISVSNHSYGMSGGWDTNSDPPRWYGRWGYAESDLFGQYTVDAMEWDDLCYRARYYLPVKSAGNERTDDPPEEGVEFEFYRFRRWQRKTYDPASDPPADGAVDGGFDTLTSISTAKNVLTVGAVYDGVSSGQRDISKAVMTGFSSWGPTDDGRIKPDLVASGVSLYSSSSESKSSYSSYYGTSMSAPCVAGAALLLIEYYQRFIPEGAMLASTLKGLLLHTADDLGQVGPDYKFGWGLVNARRAADLIRDHIVAGSGAQIIEGTLTKDKSEQHYFFECAAGESITLTLCWTDPPAGAVSGLDNPSARLVNDLDLRVVAINGGRKYYPYILDPVNPDNPAGTGDNTLDNVEQIHIAALEASGLYKLTVSHKGSLKDNRQDFSLIASSPPLSETIAGDFNEDRVVDLLDLALIAEAWLNVDPEHDMLSQAGEDIVNLQDFGRLARYWLVE